MRKATNIFKSFIHIYPTIGEKALDFFFPRHCLGCQREGKWLCLNCLTTLPSDVGRNEDQIISTFEYSSPIIRQAIWRLKYKNGRDLAETFARPMFEALLSELDERLTVSTQILLIPVPLSTKRLRERGYNQAEELAKQIANLNPEQFIVRTDLVEKIKDTPSQVSIGDRTKRLENLRGAFEIKGHCSADHLFVIIDDVSTTGATINEIRRLIIKAGGQFERIYGLVVAHG